MSEEGQSFVIAAGEKFELLHVNELDETAQAMPAIVVERLLVRTENGNETLFDSSPKVSDQMVSRPDKLFRPGKLKEQHQSQIYRGNSMNKKFSAAAISIMILTFTLAVGSPDDAKAVQGSWKPVSAELAGQPMPDAVLKSISLKLENGNYEVFVGNAPDKGTYTLDASTQPKSMTVTGTEGPNHGKTFPAIYELNGDTLRICYDLSGAKRPTEFKSVAGTKLYLVTYNRKKE